MRRAPVVLLAGPAFHLMVFWYTFAGGNPFCTKNGHWLLAVVLLGNATLVVSVRVYV
jgi:hypothetical protein